jgi:hypothetical protein
VLSTALSFGIGGRISLPLRCFALPLRALGIVKLPCTPISLAYRDHMGIREGNPPPKWGIDLRNDFQIPNAIEPIFSIKINV